tara:strand:+ start:6310 stop:6657 length:348 start_codon:yes stop_codon:yes gene_type:complete
MDYIDRYKRNYKKAFDRDFSSPEDKKISREFVAKARKDIQWGKDNGLIQEMCMQDYIKTKTRFRGTITDRIRKTVIEAEFMPDQLLADYYGLSVCSISKIKRAHRESLASSNSDS